MNAIAQPCPVHIIVAHTTVQTLIGTLVAAVRAVDVLDALIANQRWSKCPVAVAVACAGANVTRASPANLQRSRHRS